MPNTRLHKPSDNSEVATKSKHIMDDFEIPDNLRKQLEYKSGTKKRQLAIDHAQKKLLERLTTINTRLKEDKTKVSIQQSGDSLVLQATLPLKPSETSKDGKQNKQTKVSLCIPFSLEGLKTAEEEARELGRLIARKIFVWNEKYLRTKVVKPELDPTIEELLQQFENKYFATRKRSRQTLNTFESYSYHLYRFLPKTEILTDDLITKIIQKTDTGTANRINLVRALSVFCNTFKFVFDFKGYKSGYEPRKRILPTDEEIEGKFYNFKPTKFKPDYQWKSWRWIYGILATYGLRPHEVFAVHIEDFINPANILNELRLDEINTDGVKTGERVVFPLHPHWVELFNLKEVSLFQTNASFRSRTMIVGDNFRNAKIGFHPYDLRHRYAIRGHELGIPIKEMADNMGHGVEMHTKTYQKYMTIDSRRIVYQNAITKANSDENEIEQIKSENAALKAENESLKALLTQRQISDLLSK